jgi:signal peptidase I
MKIQIHTIFVGVLALVVGVVGWIYFAPTQLGGSTSYMIIRGVSMHPSIHAGDLVIIRKRSDYPIGAVVAYHDTLSKQTVLHRIVARNGSRYVFKGDANLARDAFQPTKGQMMGQKWILLPYAGTALEWVQVPTNAALLAIGAIVLAASGGAAKQRKRRPRGGPAAGAPATQRKLNPLLAAPLAVLILSLGLGAVAFGRDKSVQASISNSYQQSGDFSYSGLAKRGIVYPSGTVSTGQTVFSRLVKNLAFTFRYRLNGGGSPALSGKAIMSARITSADNQYTRSFTLAQRSFEGPRVALVGVFPLRRYTNLMEAVQTETQDPSSTYNVAITSLISIKGIVGSRSINETYSPSLNFLLDAHKLLLDRTNGAVSTHVSKSSAGTVTRANSVDLRVARPSVSTARELSIIGALLALLGLGALVALGVKRRFSDEPEQIERLYGHLLLPVTQLPEFDRIVECDSIDALATLADRYDRAILYHREGGIHTYVLQDEGLAYRYSAFDDALLRPEAYTTSLPPQPMARDAGPGQAGPYRPEPPRSTG